MGFHILSHDPCMIEWYRNNYEEFKSVWSKIFGITQQSLDDDIARRNVIRYKLIDKYTGKENMKNRIEFLQSEIKSLKKR